MPKKSDRNTFTSLWSLIERMQRNLEGEGLDEHVVDAAVTRGLETLLRGRGLEPPQEAKESDGAWGADPLLAN